MKERADFYRGVFQGERTKTQVVVDLASSKDTKEASWLKQSTPEGRRCKDLGFY